MNKICEFCNGQMKVEEHMSGLVLNDRHFICSTCVNKKKNHEILGWARVKSVGFPNLKPIHLWLSKDSIY